jgi:microcystin-dependent protein
MTATTANATTRDPVGNAPANALADVYAGDLAPAPLNSEAVTNVGGSRSHTNLMPFLCIHFIIALVGIYPSRH